jgi:ORF6N domain
MPAAAPVALIESRIYLIRGQKVLLDADLASLYQVETKVLNQAVRRNRERFPADFMFQLTRKEDEALRSQIVTSNESTGRGGRRYPPYAFTEQGIAMLSSVLSSKRAIEVNIAIMRTFVRLRQLLATHEELARRLEQLEWRQNEQGQQIQAVFETIQHLIEAPAEEPEKRRFGFPVSSHPHEAEGVINDQSDE